MKIAMIGTGYVGLVTSACLADFGHELVGYDKDGSKIDRLNQDEIPIYEPGLHGLVGRNLDAGRLAFSHDLEEALNGAEAAFIAVGTPSRRGDGYADLTYVYETANAIGERLSGPLVVVCKSTVPVGTNHEVLRRVRAARPGANVDIASNPEFLREGSAIEDFKRPDRVVVGVDTERAREVMASIYRPLSLNQAPIVFTSVESAELIKYAANAFLAMKITFINEIADLCEKVGTDVQEVARGIGLDRRIGPKFLNAGPGFGGSCFPKDTRALLQTAETAESPLRLIETVVKVNEDRKRAMAARVVAALGGSAEGATVAVLGVTFKPNTDDMREAPALDIIPALQAAGARVKAHDPEGMKEAASLLEGVDWCETPNHAIEGADALVIITEWDAYRALDLEHVKDMMHGSAFVDLRNIYRRDEVEAHGLSYFGIGIGENSAGAQAG